MKEEKNKNSIGFLGFGTMGFVLAEAFIKRGKISPHQIIALRRNKEALKKQQQTLHITIANDKEELVKQAKMLFLAVKPQQIEEALKDLPQQKDLLYLSIAAGVSLSTLSKYLPKKRICRIMPNVACKTGTMAAAFSCNSFCTQTDRKRIKALLTPLGEVWEVAEEQLAIITSISGSGPAFLAYILDAMIQAAHEEGLPSHLAHDLVAQTALGTGSLLKELKLSPQILIKKISSPNGTTVAGRAILEKSDVKEKIKATIKRAIARSKEIAEERNKERSS